MSSLENWGEHKIITMLRQFEKQAGLESIELLIPTVSFNSPAYLEFFYDEETGVASDLKIVVNKDYVDHSFIALSICHELGHVKKIKQGMNKKFIDPHTTWQWIVAEVSADREAFRIYGKPPKKEIFLWLSEKVWMTIRNLRNERYKSFIHKQLAVGIARLLAASTA